MMSTTLRQTDHMIVDFAPPEYLRVQLTLLRKCALIEC